MHVHVINAHPIASVDAQQFLDVMFIGVLARNVFTQGATYELSGRNCIAGSAKAGGMQMNKRQRRMKTCNAPKRKERRR